MSDGFRDGSHEDDPELLERIGFGENQHRRSRDRLRRPSQQKRVVRLATMVLALLLVGAAGFYLSHLVAPLVGALASGNSSDKNEDYTGPGDQPITVVIPRDASGADIGAILEKAEVVKSGSTFAKLTELDERGAKLQPGTYRVRKHMSASAALDALTDTANRSGSKVTIPEGKWKNEIYLEFSKATKIPVGEFLKVKPGDVGLPPEAKGNFEGWLFPATYEVDASYTAKDYVKQMVDQAKYQVSQLGIQPDEYQDTVIRASIIQGEGRNVPDFGKVSRVIENRMNIGMPLQMDSSIHYILKKRGTAATTTKERDSASPYNTYKNRGLPPGPISNPGADALAAAVSPTEGDWIYFVTVNPCTGETRFTNSAYEHAQNEAIFKKWDAEHKDGRCS